VDSVSGGFANEAAWTTLPEEREEQKLRHKKATKKNANVRRGRFIMRTSRKTFKLRDSP